MQVRQQPEDNRVFSLDASRYKAAIAKVSTHESASNIQRPRARRFKICWKSRGVRRAKLPESQAVELATLVDAAPSGSDWLHEIKFDGYRMLCRVANGKARFISRNGLDWTKKLPELARAAGALAVEQAMLDGEVVSLKSDGTTGFQALQNAFREGRTADLVYCVFDILHLNGRDVTDVPLAKRKELLKLAVSQTSARTIRYSDYLKGTGPNIVKQACHLHLEGIISKTPGCSVSTSARSRLAQDQVLEA